MKSMEIAMVLAATLAAGGACGGSTEDSSPSGLPSHTPLTNLSRTDIRGLCDWFIVELGGEGTRYVCGSETVVIDASDGGCVETLTSCTALVLDVEQCASEYRAALESCRLKGVPPACERIERLCAEDDAVSTSPQACISGQTSMCTCPDGSSGAHECEADGTYGDCTCLPAECISGASEACTCIDGRSGARSCLAGGTWGACICEPSGSCIPTFCPNTGSGLPCCIGPNGPCGTDFGDGCMSAFADAP